MTEKANREKMEMDFKIIINSFKKSNISVTNKDNLIIKIIDCCAVTKSRAKEYLEILQSRKIIKIDDDIIYYILVKEKKENDTTKIEKEANEFFKNLI